MKHKNPLTNDELEKALRQVYRIETRYRDQVAALCEQTGMNVSSVINACLAYGLEHVTVKPVVRAGLVFDGEEAAHAR